MSKFNIQARGLLDFALQSIDEGLADPVTRDQCFAEAEAALAILKKTLLREDQTRFAALALTRIFDMRFAEIARSDSELQDTLEKLNLSKTFFP